MSAAVVSDANNERQEASKYNETENIQKPNVEDTEVDDHKHSNVVVVLVPLMLLLWLWLAATAKAATSTATTTAATEGEKSRD